MISNSEELNKAANYAAEYSDDETEPNTAALWKIVSGLFEISSQVAAIREIIERDINKV